MALVREKLKQVPGIRSTYYLSMVVAQMAADRWRKPASFDEIFRATPDPWQSGSEAERERFALTLSMLRASGEDTFDTAVELGCAEGIFTEMLAPLCTRLLALDFSRVALDRAQQRLTHFPGVTFQRWDMRRQPLPGPFDLVAAMGVVTSLNRPVDVRRVLEMIVRAMKPGGFLIFSDVRQSKVFEDAWWGRFMLRGGEQIRRLFTRHRELELLSSADTPSHVFALFRRSLHSAPRETRHPR